MTEKLGRPLRPDEIVRHRDGDLFNNNPDNLFIVSREEHFELSMTSAAKQPWTEEEKDEAVRLYCAGMTIDEVADAVGRSYSATRRLLARWDVLRTPQATRALRAEHAARQSVEESGSEPQRPATTSVRPYEVQVYVPRPKVASVSPLNPKMRPRV